MQLNNVKSQPLRVMCGVPQGSVLGLFVFILYISDICEVSKTLRSILFADNTNLLSCRDALDELLDTVESGQQKMKSWFDSNI